MLQLASHQIPVHGTVEDFLVSQIQPRDLEQTLEYGTSEEKMKYLDPRMMGTVRDVAAAYINYPSAMVVNLREAMNTGGVVDVPLEEDNPRPLGRAPALALTMLIRATNKHSAIPGDKKKKNEAGYCATTVRFVRSRRHMAFRAGDLNEMRIRVPDMPVLHKHYPPEAGGWERMRYRSEFDVECDVPIMPPQVKEVARGCDLVAFEAYWRPSPPDPDPVLLRPIMGDWYHVVAQWNMTALEFNTLGFGE